MAKYQSCITDAKATLEKAAHLIGLEISNYPSPIAGCDEQFNHLLAERNRVRDARQALSESITILGPHS